MDCRPVPFEALPGFSPLFRAYASGDARLAPFFAHPRWDDPASLATAAGAAAAHPRDRDGLADALVAQQERYGADVAARQAAAERLRDPKAVAVLTGQQVGLFGGPLYAPFKAITAVQLARRVEAETGRPCVPVFWMATEDHDYPEVDHATLGETTLRLPMPARPAGMLNPGAVGRLVLGGDVTALVDAAVAALPEASFTAETTEMLRDAYAPGRTLGEAYACLIAALFDGTGLVIVDPDDTAVKALAPHVFARAVAARGAAEAANAAGERLADLGFHAQVTASAPGFFLLDDRGRLALDDRGDTLRLRLTGETVAPDDLVALADAAPERLSASASLRPVWQDALFPTVAYVGGPGEIAYWAQLRPVYDALGVPMPVVVPRTSATLVDAPTRRALTRLGLSVETAPADADAAFADALPPDPALDAAFADADAALARAFQSLAPALDALPEATLARSRAAAATRAQGALATLRRQADRARRRQHAQLRADLARVAAQLRPGGGLQERTLSILPFVARYGPSLVLDLVETLPLGVPAHLMVDV